LTRLPPRVRLIQRELDRFQAPEYLEIGVHIGVVLLNVRAARKVGVDPRPRIGLRRRLRHPLGMRRTELVAETSDRFFAGLDPDARFDVVFIDGLHLHEQVMRDTENALRHLGEDGAILVHDCNPTSEALAERDSTAAQAAGVSGWCGDVWKAIAELRATRSDLQVCVLDTDYGVGVIRRGPAEPVKLPVRAGDLRYADLERDRAGLLGLTPAPEPERRS
jgi:hypothetical protein